MSESANQRCSLYGRLHKQVSDLRNAGFEPDRIVVPGDEWRGVKQRGEVLGGEGVAGSDKTLVNGVRVTYRDHQPNARVVLEVDCPSDSDY